jgi:hypothetical protein
VHRFFGSRALAIVGVSLIAVVGGALLAWWQWTRYESASGTLQNLGYVLQWPLFGVFPAFMFWRIGRAAARERALDAAEVEAEDGLGIAIGTSPGDTVGIATGAGRGTGEGRSAGSGSPIVTNRADATNRADRINQADRKPAPAGRRAERAAVDPRLTYVQNRTSNYVAEEDQELLAYNHYLAQLADREQHHAG